MEASRKRAEISGSAGDNPDLSTSRTSPSSPLAATASLTRRVSFAAAHRYHRPEWSVEKNLKVFGACANPHYHGHSYVCDVTVSGPIDKTTGMIIDLGALDSALEREVRARFDHRNINLEVAEFGDGRLIPTGENLARFIFHKVQDTIGGSVVVERVVVRENDSLWAEYGGRAAATGG